MTQGITGPGPGAAIARTDDQAKAVSLLSFEEIYAALRPRLPWIQEIRSLVLRDGDVITHLLKVGMIDPDVLIYKSANPFLPIASLGDLEEHLRLTPRKFSVREVAQKLRSQGQVLTEKNFSAWLRRNESNGTFARLGVEAAVGPTGWNLYTQVQVDILIRQYLLSPPISASQKSAMHDAELLTWGLPPAEFVRQVQIAYPELNLTPGFYELQFKRLQAEKPPFFDETLARRSPKTQHWYVHRDAIKTFAEYMLSHTLGKGGVRITDLIKELRGIPRMDDLRRFLKAGMIPNMRPYEEVEAGRDRLKPAEAAFLRGYAEVLRAFDLSGERKIYFEVLGEARRLLGDRPLADYFNFFTQRHSSQYVSQLLGIPEADIAARIATGEPALGEVYRDENGQFVFDFRQVFALRDNVSCRHCTRTLVKPLIHWYSDTVNWDKVTRVSPQEMALGIWVQLKGTVPRLPEEEDSWMLLVKTSQREAERQFGTLAIMAHKWGISNFLSADQVENIRVSVRTEFLRLSATTTTRDRAETVNHFIARVGISDKMLRSYLDSGVPGVGGWSELPRGQDGSLMLTPENIRRLEAYKKVRERLADHYPDKSLFWDGYGFAARVLKATEVSDDVLSYALAWHTLDEFVSVMPELGHPVESTTVEALLSADHPRLGRVVSFEDRLYLNCTQMGILHDFLTGQRVTERNLPTNKIVMEDINRDGGVRSYLKMTDQGVLMAMRVRERTVGHRGRASLVRYPEVYDGVMKAGINLLAHMADLPEYGGWHLYSGEDGVNAAAVVLHGLDSAEHEASVLKLMPKPYRDFLDRQNIQSHAAMLRLWLTRRLFEHVGLETGPTTDEMAEWMQWSAADTLRAYQLSSPRLRAFLEKPIGTAQETPSRIRNWMALAVGDQKDALKNLPAWLSVSGNGELTYRDVLAAGRQLLAAGITAEKIASGDIDSNTALRALSILNGDRFDTNGLSILVNDLTMNSGLKGPQLHAAIVGLQDQEARKLFLDTNQALDEFSRSLRQALQVVEPEVLSKGLFNPLTLADIKEFRAGRFPKTLHLGEIQYKGAALADAAERIRPTKHHSAFRAANARLAHQTQVWRGAMQTHALVR